MSKQDKKNEDDDGVPVGLDYLAGYVDNPEEPLHKSIWKKIKSLFN